MIVVDASAVVELLADGPRADAVAEALEVHEGELHMPAHVDAEVAQVMRRLEREGWLASIRAAAAIRELERFPATRHGPAVLLPAIWALRSNLTAYDAAYVALAAALRCPLLTLDRKLAAAPGTDVDIQVPA